jgi:hypothetical protein
MARKSIEFLRQFVPKLPEPLPPTDKADVPDSVAGGDRAPDEER